MSFQFNPFTGTFDIAADNELKTEFVTLTAEQVQAKRIELKDPPQDPLRVRLTVIAGIEQRSGQDFYVEGNELIWENLALELLVEPGSFLIITYY